MKIRIILAALALVAGAHSLAAQTVVAPEPKLAPEKQKVTDAVYQLRDSLMLIDAAGARFARDRNQASDASMQSRSRLMATRCRNAIGTADSTKASVTEGGQPVHDPRAVRARMENAIVELRSKLTWCDGEFERLSQPANSTELRGYGIGRAEQVSQSVQKFIAEIDYYFKQGLGTRYKPSIKGAGSVASGAPRK